MLPAAGSKPEIAAINQLQTYMLDHMATRFSTKYY